MQNSRLFPSAWLLPAVVLLALAGPGVGFVHAQTGDDPCTEGRDLYREARFSEARDALRRCLDVEGESVDALLPLTVMAVQEERLQEGVEYGGRAVAVAPEDPEAHYWFGRSLLRANRIDEAKAQWEKGLALSMNHKGILEGLARLSLAEGDPVKAYNLLTHLQRQGVNEGWLCRLLADIAAGKGLWSQSLAHLREAMALDGASIADLLAASELSLMVGDRGGAITYCRQAVAAEPGPATYGGLGEAFFSVQEVDSALVYLRLAVEQDPGNPRFRFNLANALEVAGELEEAEIHFVYFLEAEPNDAVGHFNYGIHLQRLGRMQTALAHVSRAVELDSTMLSAQIVKAQMLENLSRWDEALVVVQELRAADPANEADLIAWEQRIGEERDRRTAAMQAGKVHLLHMVISGDALLEQVMKELREGADFGSLAVRFSGGPAAARGGDIGWIIPDEMVEPLRSEILALGEHEISPPIESRGLYHLFKRIP